MISRTVGKKAHEIPILFPFFEITSDERSLGYIFFSYRPVSSTGTELSKSSCAGGWDVSSGEKKKKKKISVLLMLRLVAHPCGGGRIIAPSESSGRDRVNPGPSDISSLSSSHLACSLVYGTDQEVTRNGNTNHRIDANTCVSICLLHGVFSLELKPPRTWRGNS